MRYYIRETVIPIAKKTYGVLKLFDCRCYIKSVQSLRYRSSIFCKTPICRPPSSLKSCLMQFFLVIYMPIYQQQINVGGGCKQVLCKKLAAGIKPSLGM